ncbi:hypothetical protein X975_26206, partial [Stegodyphus mimosarum]
MIYANFEASFRTATTMELTMQASSAVCVFEHITIVTG